MNSRSWVGTGSIFALAALLATGVWAQQGGGQGGGQTGGGNTGGGNTGGGNTGGLPGGNTGGGRTTPGLGNTNTQDPFGNTTRDPFGSQRRPMFISGKVMTADGTAVPQGAVVERVCNGQPRPEGYVDQKGNFSFQLGQNSMMMMDASTSSTGFGGFGNQQSGFGSPAMQGQQGVSEQELIGCELRINAPGYRSTVFNLSGRRAMDNPNIGTLILTPLANVQGTSVSIFTLKAPKKARKAYDKGIEEARKQKWDKAEEKFQEAIKEYPEYAQAWYDLGRVQEGQEKAEDARASFQKAIEIDSKFVSPHLGLARLAMSKQDWSAVANESSRAVQLNPIEFPEAFFYNAIAHYNMQNMPYAESSIRETLKLDPGHRLPKAEYLLALIMAQKGNLKEATSHMKAYMQFAPNAPDASQVQAQVSEWEAKIGGPVAEASNN